MGSSPRRTTARRDGARRAGARRGARAGARRGGAHSSQRSTAPSGRRWDRIGWPRRIGVALGVLVLGASAVLAGQALDGPGGPERPDGPSGAGVGPNGSPVAGPGAGALAGLGPPDAPLLEAPARATTTESEVDLSGTLPADLIEGQADRLRIYVNDDLVRTRRLPRSPSFTLRDIPLAPGENRISAALIGPGGEGPRSAPMVVVRDSNEPVIVISAPRPGTLLTTPQVTIRGRTEPLATVSVTNLTVPGESTADADADGQFQAVVALALGINQIVVASRDSAGNGASARLELVRSESLARIALTVSDVSLLLTRLPTELDIAATVHDEQGLPVDGVVVFFSLSVPGQAATTYRATTVNGTASWPDVRVPRSGTTKGRGRVTAQVTLPTSQQVVETASFSVR